MGGTGMGNFRSDKIIAIGNVLGRAIFPQVSYMWKFDLFTQCMHSLYASIEMPPISGGLFSNYVIMP